MTDIELTPYDYVITEGRFALVVEPQIPDEFRAMITADDGGYLEKTVTASGLQRIHITTVSKAARDQYMDSFAEVIEPVARSSAYDIQVYEVKGVCHGWVFWYQDREL